MKREQHEGDGPRLVSYRASARGLPGPPVDRWRWHRRAAFAALLAAGVAWGVVWASRHYKRIDVRVWRARRALRPTLDAVQLPVVFDAPIEPARQCTRLTIGTEQTALDNVAVLDTWPEPERSRALAALPAPWGGAAPLVYRGIVATSELAYPAVSPHGAAATAQLRARLRDLRMFAPSLYHRDEQRGAENLGPSVTGAAALPAPCPSEALAVYADGRVPYGVVHRAMGVAAEAGYTTLELAARRHGIAGAIWHSPVPPMNPAHCCEMIAQPRVVLRPDGADLFWCRWPCGAECRPDPAHTAHLVLDAEHAANFVELRRRIVAMVRASAEEAALGDFEYSQTAGAPHEVRERAFRRAVNARMRDGVTEIIAAPDVPWRTVVATIAATRFIRTVFRVDLPADARPPDDAATSVPSAREGAPLTVDAEDAGAPARD